MTTPREMAILLGHVLRPTLNGGAEPGPLPPEVCRQMLDILRRQQVRDRLPLLLAPAVDIAHKTGSVSRVSNDAGILYTPKSPCIVTVFTRDLADDLKGRMAIAQVGQAVYEAYS
ncbi:MAG TPA: serine hydrolase [bacterium]